jgi:hypothetical protein
VFQITPATTVLPNRIPTSSTASPVRTNEPNLKAIHAGRGGVPHVRWAAGQPPAVEVAIRDLIHVQREKTEDIRRRRSIMKMQW